MRVLVACEFSGRVRDAFRRKGHEAWSCDLLAGEGEFKQFHYQEDVLGIINNYDFDLMIAHPPCTYLANSGVQHMYKNRKKELGICPKRWESMLTGAEFFKQLLNADIPKIAVENPVQHGFAKQKIQTPYNQIVQPYFFGEEVQKKTCLWLKNLPQLRITNLVSKGDNYIGKNGKANGSKWYQLAPHKDRWKHRSTTFQGIAIAMAEQWGVV